LIAIIFLVGYSLGIPLCTMYYKSKSIQTQFKENFEDEIKEHNELMEDYALNKVSKEEYESKMNLNINI